MKVFLVEDEYLGLDRLIRLLAQIDSSIDVLGHAESIRSAVQWLQNNPAPDLLFMDIELADGQCFEIFKQTQVDAPVVFTTSYDEFALNAFKVNSIDYLLKPIKKEELAAALNKYRRLRAQGPSVPLDVAHLIRELRAVQQPQEYRQRFLLKQGQRWISVETHEIAWFSADGKICFARTWDNRRFLVDYTLEELSQMLNPADFYRVNRSYLVHAKAVTSIEPYFGGKLLLHLSPKTEHNDVVVPKQKANAFKVWMGK